MGELHIFPNEYSNVFYWRESKEVKEQKKFFKEILSGAKDKDHQQNLLFCWEYIKRGIWEFDLKTGDLVYSKSQKNSKKA